jgi:hypothetical protein
MVTGYQWNVDMDIDMGCGISISIWELVYWYGHLEYRYWIRDIAMGDASIDMVILNIDIIGYLVTLPQQAAAPSRACPTPPRC